MSKQIVQEKMDLEDAISSRLKFQLILLTVIICIAGADSMTLTPQYFVPTNIRGQ